MSRAISSYPEHLRAAVARRRSQNQSGGLGYWAAIDAQRRLAQIAHAAALPRESELEAHLEDVA